MISMDTRMKIIAHIHTDFPDKFGIPRQSSLVEGLTGEITFEPEYRNPEIIRGIEQFSHIWLLWKFSESKKEHWSATVKPPRLGGKVRPVSYTHLDVYKRQPYGRRLYRF